ncbi:hypothetical protein MKW94_022324 [Papaver nudicaule]|uniref:F-box domain-containing protein n=1 Tax=Papaver nudicaule TaxID=74823 RepID=A0AA41SIU5_PAPNU|nr:hypothetical protein [Papaver nudicaule]
MMAGRANSSSGVQKKKAGHIKDLPDDILVDIMSRLPVESVLECKLVCKKLQKLLHGKRSFFTYMHVSRQLNLLHGGGDADKLDMGLLFGFTTDHTWQGSIFYGGSYNDKINTDETYEYKKTLKKVRHPSMHHQLLQEYLVGSCNGVVCLGRYHHRCVDPIYVYNPATGEYVNLPKLIIPKGTDFPCLARGFGYVPSTNEYKVVRIFYPTHGAIGEVQVYTLGSGCGWRTKSTPFPWLNFEAPAACVDGSMYWFDDSIVYAFDLANEEMHTVPSLPCHNLGLGSLPDDNFGVVILRGKLCYFHQTLSAPHMEIWSLMKIDMKESWCKDFSILYEKQEQSYVEFFWPILVTRNDEIIFIKDFQTLHCYNSKTTTWKEIVAKDPHFHVESTWVIYHVNTFVSLKTLGEKSSKKSCRSKMIGRLNVGSLA